MVERKNWDRAEKSRELGKDLSVGQARDIDAFFKVQPPSRLVKPTPPSDDYVALCGSLREASHGTAPTSTRADETTTSWLNGFVCLGYDDAEERRVKE